MSRRQSNQTAKVEQVIISHEVIGDGTSNDPSRILIVIRTLDGNIIAEDDPMDRLYEKKD